MRQRDECYPCLDSLLYLHRSRIPAISQQTAVSTAAFRVRSWLVPLALNFLDDKIACSSRLAGGGLSLGYCHMAATCSLYVRWPAQALQSNRRQGGATVLRGSERYSRELAPRSQGTRIRLGICCGRRRRHYPASIRGRSPEHRVGGRGAIRWDDPGS